MHQSFCIQYDIIYSLSTLRVLPQSARWLLANDRREEAIVLLRKAATVNGRVLPPTIQVPHRHILCFSQCLSMQIKYFMCVYV